MTEMAYPVQTTPDGRVWDLEAQTVNGVPATGDDLAFIQVRRGMWDTRQAVFAASDAFESCRTALAAVLALAEAYPYPTPEETAIVDAQAAAALDGFRALNDPPADVVALAAAVVSWRATA